MNQYKKFYPGCYVLLDPEKEKIEVNFYDETFTVGAVEQGDPVKNYRYAETAKLLGYSGPKACWQMCSENEQLHIIIAQAQRLEHSPVLWKMAHGIKLAPFELHWEERRVMTMMKYMNGVFDDDVVHFCTWLSWSNIDPVKFRLDTIERLRG